MKKYLGGLIFFSPMIFCFFKIMFECQDFYGTVIWYTFIKILMIIAIVSVTTFLGLYLVLGE